MNVWHLELLSFFSVGQYNVLVLHVNETSFKKSAGICSIKLNNIKQAKKE